ncbi:tetratricopeptide repeat protein [Nostoc sp. FACHB-892]|uniref:McrB family protein n=1 Tax=Nostoc sp. FACHB-892 TaxID=2692843 RepID=UPI00168693FC|nr:tetratricopeptide repeat protein [Nostoc sp. FACHB-892]MBD2728220.1 tetratricopeptide repeat protein [Nostoc sp. FACHB-892]
MTEVFVNPECPFSLKSFDLLTQLKEHSTKKAFYLRNEKDFKKYIEQPFEQLYQLVIAQLSGEIIKYINTDTQLDNDLSEPFFEYNLFSKTMELQWNNAHFFIRIIQYGLWVGLYIPEKSLSRKKFIQNVQHNTILKEILLQNIRIDDNFSLFSESSQQISKINRLADWLKIVARQKTATKCIQVTKYIASDEILNFEYQQLTNEIKQMFEGIFPLFLAATCDEPITAIEKYLAQINIVAQYYFLEGVNKHKEGNYQDAIEKFDLALEQAPNSANVYRYRGKVKAESGYIDDAISDYNYLLLIQPKDYAVYDERGHIYYKLENYDKALDDYNQSLHINPNFALAYYHRGLTYLEINNQQKALDDLCRATELFYKEKDVDNYEKAQRILKTIYPDYSEPLFTEINQNIRSKGLRISESILRRYHLALKTRKFVIISGTSGTGKTWLTKAYAEVVAAEYLLVPVAPNWTTNEDLLGYFNPMDKEYHYTAFSHFLEKAAQEYEQAQTEKRTPKPYHLILDEMNLARVEYYFAKFLSVMEVRMREGLAQIELASEKQVLLPPNLYFIGTVNVDETTHNFADKVYDRAQMIEIEVCRNDLFEHLGEVEYREILMEVWDNLHLVTPFAFRVLDEINNYVNEAKLLDISWEEALDEQLLQKILPKLKGADDRVGEALKAFVDIAENKFNLSHAKASKMLKTFEQHGFTSYF